MDEKDQELVRLLQKGLPVVAEPFQALGDKLWIDEVSVISRLVRMRQEGIIRRVGAFFDTRKLGMSGVLAAIDAPPDRIDLCTKVINRYPEVTHHYRREGNPNLWFTVTAANQGELDRILGEIGKEIGDLRILLFPARRMFKARVELE